MVIVWVGDVVGLRTIDRFRASGSMVSDASGQIRKVIPLKKIIRFYHSGSHLCVQFMGDVMDCFVFAF